MSHQRLRLGALVLALALVLGPAAATGDAARSPATVGTITSISGTRNVKVKATARATARRARVGMRLRVGATIVLGRGARATLRLRRPASVGATRDLVYIRSAPGTKHRNTVTRDATGIVVRIVPS